MGMRALLLLVMLAVAAGKASAAPSGASPIKNVVVLALENRSFDHMLGWMRRLLGLPIDGLTGAECNVDPTNSSLPPVCVSADASLVVPDDPGHSFEDVLNQVFGFHPNSTAGAADQLAPPTMSGFVRSALSVNSPSASQWRTATARRSAHPRHSAMASCSARPRHSATAIPGEGGDGYGLALPSRRRRRWLWPRRRIRRRRRWPAAAEPWRFYGDGRDRGAADARPLAAAGRRTLSL